MYHLVPIIFTALNINLIKDILTSSYGHLLHVQYMLSVENYPDLCSYIYKTRKTQTGKQDIYALDFRGQTTGMSAHLSYNSQQTAWWLYTGYHTTCDPHVHLPCLHQYIYTMYIDALHASMV